MNDGTNEPHKKSKTQVSKTLDKTAITPTRETINRPKTDWTRLKLWWETELG